MPWFLSKYDKKGRIALDTLKRRGAKSPAARPIYRIRVEPLYLEQAGRGIALPRRAERTQTSRARAALRAPFRPLSGPAETLPPTWCRTGATPCLFEGIHDGDDRGMRAADLQQRSNWIGSCRRALNGSAAFRCRSFEPFPKQAKHVGRVQRAGTMGIFRRHQAQLRSVSEPLSLPRRRSKLQKPPDVRMPVSSVPLNGKGADMTISLGLLALRAIFVPAFVMFIAGLEADLRPTRLTPFPGPVVSRA